MFLTSVEIPSSVTSIGDSAFSGCVSLTSVEIPSSVTSIGKSAFDRCINLTSISIGNGITFIGEMAFYRCTGLTSVKIPSSVVSIGYMAFCSCGELTKIEFGGTQAQWKNIVKGSSWDDGIGWNATMTTIYKTYTVACTDGTIEKIIYKNIYY